MFQSAGQAEILRSNQKDQYYVGYLQRSLADILQSVAGKLRRKFQLKKQNKTKQKNKQTNKQNQKKKKKKKMHLLTNW